MRQVIQQSPALLPALLQQLGQENPQLLQVGATAPLPSQLHLSFLVSWVFCCYLWGGGVVLLHHTQ